MKRCAAVLAMSAGCVSIGGGMTVNGALDDAPVRRVGGSIQLGTLAEVVEDRLIGQLQYSRDAGPLGGHANALGAWGARVTRLPRGRLPGLYVLGAYGQNDDATQPKATSIIAGAGVAYGRMLPGTLGRTWAGVSAGLVYHRSHQATIDDDRPGQFLGLEVTISAGFDLLGPMYGRGD